MSNFFGKNIVTFKETVAVDKQDLIDFLHKTVTCEYESGFMLDLNFDFLAKCGIKVEEYYEWSHTEARWVRNK